MRRPLLLLALWAALPPAAAAPPFTASAHYSKFKRLTHVTGDVADPAVLARLVEHKAWLGELILFAFNTRWLDWAVNMAANLHHGTAPSERPPPPSR